MSEQKVRKQYLQNAHGILLQCDDLPGDKACEVVAYALSSAYSLGRQDGFREGQESKWTKIAWDAGDPCPTGEHAGDRCCHNNAPLKVVNHYWSLPAPPSAEKEGETNG